MGKQVLVIGGGIIGLCSAYYLQKQGCQVSIIDQSHLNAGASYVNAGYLSPSHIIPLAAPGVMKKGLKWMFNPASPLYIKPRLELDFLKWVWAFHKSCNYNHVKKAIPAIKNIALWSQDLYDAIKQDEQFNFHYEKKGLLMLCQTEKLLDDEIKTLHIAKQEGLEATSMTPEELKKLEPQVNINAIGATYYKCDSHTTPHEFMAEMKTYLKAKGVEFILNEKVEDIEVTNNTIQSVKTKNQLYKAEEFVLATGSWSSILTKKIGLQLLVQPGKGYRINKTQPTGIQIPAILAEAKVAVTPMNGFTRFAGTMEIDAINHNISKVRVEAIANAVSKYYPEIKITQPEKEQATCGLRPISPDGLPFIGKSAKCSNLTIATGHAMMGWSMGTGTGKLVSEIVLNKKPSFNIQLYHPDRKF